MVEAKTQAIVALGKNWRKPIDHTNPHLSVESAMTARAAGIIYLQGKARNQDLKIVFSTGSTIKGSPVTEAAAMKQHLRKHYSADEIPDKDIILEEDSVDTDENAEKVRKILDDNNLSLAVLLTVKYHTGRSRRLFKRHGMVPDKIVASDSTVATLSDDHAEAVMQFRHSPHVIMERTKEAVLLGFANDRGSELVRRVTTHSRR